MKLLPNLLITSLLTFLPFETTAQQATTPASANSTQATALLSQSAAALTGGVTLTDVTLSGTARRIVGSDDESGTAVLKALATGESRMDLSFPSGPRGEVRANSASGPAGTWSGPDGVSHALAYHNLLTGPAWFFPEFTIARLISSQNSVLSYTGQETRNGQSVLHVTASQQISNASGQTAALLQHLTQLDIFLDPSTYLPVAFDFNTHPDNDAGLDIPIEIRFSDYRPVSGAQVPFHVQKFLNNGLVLDLQFQSAVFNSGLSPAAFTVGAGL